MLKVETPPEEDVHWDMDVFFGKKSIGSSTKPKPKPKKKATAKAPKKIKSQATASQGSGGSAGGARSSDGGTGAGASAEGDGDDEGVGANPGGLPPHLLKKVKTPGYDPDTDTALTDEEISLLDTWRDAGGKMTTLKSTADSAFPALAPPGTTHSKEKSSISNSSSERSGGRRGSSLGATSAVSSKSKGGRLTQRKVSTGNLGTPMPKQRPSGGLVSPGLARKKDGAKTPTSSRKAVVAKPKASPLGKKAGGAAGIKTPPTDTSKPQKAASTSSKASSTLGSAEDDDLPAKALTSLTPNKDGAGKKGEKGASPNSPAGKKKLGAGAVKKVWDAGGDDEDDDSSDSDEKPTFAKKSLPTVKSNPPSVPMKKIGGGGNGGGPAKKKGSWDSNEKSKPGRKTNRWDSSDSDDSDDSSDSGNDGGGDSPPPTFGRKKLGKIGNRK
jgi:hypothetical protein